MIKTVRTELEYYNKNIAFQTIGTPREGKNLAILDLDYTILDPNTLNPNIAGRPYLHQFLGKLYENYDIGLWSSSGMDVLKSQIHMLDMNNHLDYEILFYSDLHVMLPVPQFNNIFRVKALDIVWQIFPEHNRAKTVFCDDGPENFHLCPKNGIVVPPYFSRFYHEDDELLKLSAYLEYVAEYNDVRKLNHIGWRKKVVPDSY